MGLDSRDYARKLKLDYGSGQRSSVATVDGAYHIAVGSRLKVGRWFFMPLLFVIAAMSPLIVLQLAEKGLFNAAFLNELQRNVFLPGDSKDHFVLVGASAVLFLLIACTLFTFRLSTIVVFSIATILGTVGSIWLLQKIWVLAAASSPPTSNDFSINNLLFAIKVGYSSLEHRGGQVQGYLLGVGVAEELAKVLPIFLLVPFGFTSRIKLITAFGLGVGFGLAESIHYSEQFYNGNAALPIYIVRFISLVALHGMWTTIAYGSIALFKNKAFAWMDQSAEPFQFVLFLGALALAPAILLHGFYDVYVGTPKVLYPLIIIAMTCVLFSFIVYRRRASLVIGDWFNRS